MPQIYINDIGIDNFINGNGIDRHFGTSKWTCFVVAFIFLKCHSRLVIAKRHTCQQFDTRVYLYSMFVQSTLCNWVIELKESAQCRNLILFLVVSSSMHSDFAFVPESNRHLQQLHHSSLQNFSMTAHTGKIICITGHDTRGSQRTGSSGGRRRGATFANTRRSHVAKHNSLLHTERTAQVR